MASITSRSLPVRLAMAGCFGLLVSSVSPAAEPFVWFGTYTGGPAKSEGIYVSRFDGTSGALSPPRLAVAAERPSFLAVHPTLPVLYAVSEAAESAGILSFTIDEATGMLAHQSRQPSGGGGPCHVSVDPTGRVVLAANYGGGSVICLGLKADGSLEPVATGTPGGFLQHEGRGGNSARQEKPHGHAIYSSPDARFALACDLGLDKVLVHSLDAAKATLTPHGFGATKPGAGPRHFALHPNGQFGYSVNELDRTVTAFAFDPKAGSLAAIETLSTLPADVAESAGGSTAEIFAHPSGKFLYASNRGHDSIAMYAVDGATGKLTFLGAEPIRGKTPRGFAIDPSGKFLLAGGQGSNTVTVFAIDGSTGRLSLTGRPLDVPCPVCVCFRPTR